MEVPRPEHPRPIWRRDDWINLNGEWSFEFDFGRSGIDRGLGASRGFGSKITVPFCPESSLSGVGYRDFIPALWYHRCIAIPESWHGRDVHLNIGACDYYCEVYIDGLLTGQHWGGSSSFAVNITPFVRAGSEHHLVILAGDDLRSGVQLGGKQSVEFHSAGCFYTRVTGLWQTVWLEAVSPHGLADCWVTAVIEEGAFGFRPRFRNVKRGQRFRVRLLENDNVIAESSCPAVDGAQLSIRPPSPALWSPDAPYLYDIEYSVIDGSDTVQDRVASYAALRSVHTEGNTVYLNNQPIYLRLVLDQGYYPDGIWTAPSDQALKDDIRSSLALGFNGARLHQKIFEPRFHYWADRMGYLTWGESPSWGLDIKKEMGARNYLCEWREIVLRDRNHPSLIAWTTFNESWDLSDRKQHRRLHLDAYDLTKALDPTRPINNASGGCHVRTDLYTVHIYEQDPERLRAALAKGENGSVFRTLGDKEAQYEGQPYIVDEWGGIKWMPDALREAKASWGYGDPPVSLEDFYRRLRGQVDAILSQSHIGGYCYTQLTDVEQEQNGLLYYDRTEKFDSQLLRAIFSRNPGDLPHATPR